MRYARSPKVLWRSTTSGPVVLPVDGEAPELLGGLAALLWELLDEATEQPDLVRAAHDFAGHPVPVAPALHELVERALVVTRPPG